MSVAARSPSLRRRISLLVLLASAGAILLVSIVLASVHHREAKRSAYASLRAQATIAALNSAAPLAFGDFETADEVLRGLSRLPDIRSARLYDAQGRRFAAFERPGGAAIARGLLAEGEHALGGHYAVVLPVSERDERFGTLQVVYDLGPLRAQLLRNMLLAAAVGTLALLLSVGIARKGASLLVRRLALLDAAARRVSETQDYSVRAPELGEDEIGRFTRTFNAMLAQIERQDEELRESRQRALEASRLKDEFLATISHELRTPITPIAGWAHILRQVAPDNPRVLEAAAVIERNVNAMKSIVNDLLDMSAIVSGKVVLHPGQFPARELVHDALEAVRQAAAKKQVAVSAEAAPGLVLDADRQRLQQVVWNLATNAVKFTPAGGRVAIHARREGDAAVIEVSDTGEGIAADFLPHMFDRFRQADSSITRRHGGLGLGLAIVRQLVELHGGSIAAHSDGPGQGARFTVVLPGRAVDAPAPPAGDAAGAADADAPRQARLAGLTVLVVEDDADSREWLLRVLAAEGARVRGAQDADAGLAALHAQAPDVLVSDLGMPGKDGYQLVAELRGAAQQAIARVPALALSAYAREEDRQRALAAGFDAHLGKPVDPDALVQCLRRLARG